MSQNLLNISSDNYLHLIEWDELIKNLNKFIHFKYNKDENLKRPSYLAPKLVNAELDSLDKFLSSFSPIDFSSLSSDFEHLETLQYIKKGRSLIDPQILGTYWCLRLFKEKFKIFQNSLAGIDGQLKQDLYKTLQNLDKHLPPVVKYDEIDYSSHPYVVQISNEISSLKNTGRNTISKVIKNLNREDVLQYSGFDYINNSFVIPIRSDRYRSGLGKICGQSNRGQTVYVEPVQLRAINQKIEELNIKFEESTNKIRREISDVLFKSFENVDFIIRKCFAFDFYQGRAIFCTKYNLRRQSFSLDNSYHIKDFFHPLIDHAVTNNLVLDHSNKCLLISGPNAGGKTVVLKTLILFQLLSYKGIFVSAEEAKFPLHSKIYFISHDFQSVISGLSSFSSEVKALEELFLDIPENGLVCIDEIFRSTNSKEASCISMPLILELFKFKNIKLFVTTHHPLLKELAAKEPDILNSHVTFNERTHRPTYRLQIGSSSESFAIDTFKEVSPILGEKITPLALHELNKHSSDHENQHIALKKKMHFLDEKMAECKQLTKQLKFQKENYEDLLKSKIKTKLQKIDQKFEKILANIDQSANSKKSIMKAKVELKELDPYTEKFEIKQSHDNEITQIPRPGMSYFSKSLKKSIEVKKINLKKNQVLCSLSGKQIWLPVSDLKGKAIFKKPTKNISISVSSTRSPHLKVDGRGMRREEFSNEVNLAILDLLNGKIPHLEVIHGFGEGILLRELNNILQKYQDIDSERTTGNMGSTRLTLKKE